MIYLRRLLVGVTSLLLFVTVWILWPQELDGFIGGRDGKLSVPDYAMTNARFVSVKDGRVEMETRAKDTTYDLAERRMISRTVTARLFDAEGKATLVTADEATFLQNDRKALLTGHVRSESPDGFVLNGSRTEYFMDKKFLLAPAPVDGAAPDKSVKVWANRAESYLGQRKLSLIGDARAEFREDKKGVTKIRGDRAEVDREKEEIEFKKNVRTAQNGTTGSSNSATISYGTSEQSRKKGLRYMSLLDDVVIKEPGGRYTRSQVAEFFAPTDTVVLSGFPAVYNGEDAVTGDRITLYRNTGVVEVTQTNAAASGIAPKGKAPPVRPLTKEDEELIP
ncbi:MAG: LPS export ABC transporter periplasmic protein LptC [Proteobacteria bacterium]|nr:MAG: LPS export ABC transporter periplasmic protein LptC [Pseudomonadota bacterium]